MTHFDARTDTHPVQLPEGSANPSGTGNGDAAALAALTAELTRDAAVASWVQDARSPHVPNRSLQAPTVLLPFLAAAAAHPELGGQPVLLITPTVRAAEDFQAVLEGLLPPHTTAIFPSWETLPHERLSPSPDIVGQRTHVLRRLAHPDPVDAHHGPIQVLVAPIRSVLAPIVSGLGDVAPVVLRRGDDASIGHLVGQLVAAGYERTDLVERRGQFAVRGGIVDVFPPTERHPVRLEFFGDEVDDLRTFAVTDQRSLEPIAQLWAPVCKEVLLTEDVRGRAAAAARSHPGLADLLEPMSQGMSVPGMEAVAPLVVSDMTTLVELLPANALVLVAEPERVAARAAELVQTSAEFLAAGLEVAADGGELPIDLARSAYISVADLTQRAQDQGIRWWEAGPLTQEPATTSGTADPDNSASAQSDLTDVTVHSEQAVDAMPAPSYRGDLGAVATDIQGRLAESDRVVIVAGGPGSAKRLVESLGEWDVPARLCAQLAPTAPAPVTEVVTGAMLGGFVAESAGLVVLTESDVFGTAAPGASTRMPSRRRKAVDPMSLAPGDYVVHEHHGVGRYMEMVTRKVAATTREYLVIEYAASKRGQPPDRLFVPTEQLQLVTRYVGGEAPTVHRLGGADWQKAKGKARKAVGQIVAGLVRLYAARQNAQGRTFGSDTPWQRELEDAFPFAETPDQLACIDEVKADMEKPMPMDRVICGDVGFGKTEIAVRAAFKAVSDGTQVVVLVPTTLLASQHLKTFRARFAPFPVRVEGLSRFTSDAEAKAILAGLADGSVDVVIGTHRLLGPNTKLKDLGLVIVDEEQRFGVEHKEHLKALRTNVDVLTMSATPIPRTLEMAITGIREMSTIATPPEDRLPVLTYVGPYREKQVGAAIRRELARDGQVFFVHNRVESINKVAARISALVPEARVAVAHGQMRESELEKVMVDFWERSFDVLVSTTIVESGLDIPNANTLIVDRADMFGLSQLHQIRGRVGRGRERAYAYFLYNPDRTLSETAYERLSTIAQRSDLGAGMAVAMKDLEIRGAGNLLGGEQAGHIADIGFDLYVRMVGEALAEVKGEASEHLPTKLELPLDAHIPHTYIPDERLRLAAYRAFAEAATPEALTEVLAEMHDRFGRPPAPVVMLGAAAGLRQRLSAVGITEAVALGERLRCEGVALPESMQMRLSRLYPGAVLKPASRTVLLPLPKTARVGGKILTGVELIAWVDGFIETITGLQPGVVRKEST